MELESLERHWNAFGERDPLWAILTVPEKRGGGRDTEEFFASGRWEADEVLRVISDRGVVVERGRALDFGCGVGRLTQALAERFETCDGVDVAASMIERARELNRTGERVRFHHNNASDLALFDDGSFDFILALIVFQHMEPSLMRGYLREFVRVLRPGGVAFFNIPDRFGLEALPPEAWRASLTLVGTIPPLAPGKIAPLRVRVRNESSVPWPASPWLRVGNHWRSSSGKLVAFDDARAAIDDAVDPGGECEVQLEIVAPVDPGEYQLEIDLVQEWIGWFADRGSSALTVPVVIAGVAGAPGTGPPPAARRPTSQGGHGVIEPEMEMHVLAGEEVVATVENAGGVVLDVTSKERCPPWLSLDYVVARAVAPATGRPRAGRRDPQARIEARIREALEDRDPASGIRSQRLVGANPERSERHRVALHLLDERADLVGFALSSTRKGVGRASNAMRGALRRALLEVLHRQTEHNRTSDELIRSHETQLEALGATVRAQLEIQAAADERLDALARRLAALKVNAVAVARRGARGVVQPDFDHLGFTERFRGTTEEIRGHQRRYLPLFEGVSDVLDAGCGRGEFLELLREAGIGAVGVDADQAMVYRCRHLGLGAIQDDALHFLRGRPEQSHGGILAAHLVEHLEREDIVELVRLAFTRLRPAGVLVIETVNPTCLLTYATFYGDFTRVGPVPPLALKWLAESCGFAEVEIEYTLPVPAEDRLRPLPPSAGDEAEVEAFNRGLALANELLFGFQEYALVARKPG
jgi:2-polyprenyl-3-methyl-5-hydroxy-6-metoxy-1,4-benzoquinol methylase